MSVATKFGSVKILTEEFPSIKSCTLTSGDPARSREILLYLCTIAMLVATKPVRVVTFNEELPSINM